MTELLSSLNDIATGSVAGLLVLRMYLEKSQEHEIEGEQLTS